MSFRTENLASFRSAMWDRESVSVTLDYEPNPGTEWDGDLYVVTTWGADGPERQEFDDLDEAKPAYQKQVLSVIEVWDWIEDGNGELVENKLPEDLLKTVRENALTAMSETAYPESEFTTTGTLRVLREAYKHGGRQVIEAMLS